MGTDRLTIQQVAERLGLSLSTLYTWRSEGRGPVSHRFAGRIYYDAAHVEAWVEAEKQRTARGEVA